MRYGPAHRTRKLMTPASVVIRMLVPERTSAKAFAAFIEKKKPHAQGPNNGVFEGLGYTLI